MNPACWSLTNHGVLQITNKLLKVAFFKVEFFEVLDSVGVGDDVVPVAVV